MQTFKERRVRGEKECKTHFKSVSDEAVAGKGTIVSWKVAWTLAKKSTKLLSLQALWNLHCDWKSTIFLWNFMSNKGESVAELLMAILAINRVKFDCLSVSELWSLLHSSESKEMVNSRGKWGIHIFHAHFAHISHTSWGKFLFKIMWVGYCPFGFKLYCISIRNFYRL